MEEQLTIEQLPQALREKLNETIEKHPTVINLRKQIEQCLKKGDYVGMAQAMGKISEIQKLVETEYLKKNSVVVKRLETFKSEMSEDDQDRMSVNANMIIMLADILEMCCIEINEIVKKYQPEYRIEMFDDMERLAKSCYEQIRFMWKNTDDYYQSTFSYEADNVRMMIVNKVKSLLRKVYKHNERKAV